MYKLDLEKVEEPEIRLPTFIISWRKQRNSRKIICFTDYAKALDDVDHNKLWKILKDLGIPDHSYLSPEKHVCRSRSNN